LQGFAWTEGVLFAAVTTLIARFAEKGKTQNENELDLADEFSLDKIHVKERLGKAKKNAKLAAPKQQSKKGFGQHADDQSRPGFGAGVGVRQEREVATHQVAGRRCGPVGHVNNESSDSSLPLGKCFSAAAFKKASGQAVRGVRHSPRTWQRFHREL
jgi:hypothetical protein